jgi:lysosomal acid lipase/cholesteryl ester hydrolase
MYDDEYQAPWSVSDNARFYKVPRFPTRNIKTPILLVWGGNDSLVDINTMLKELPKHTVAKEIPHYEHLDFLWAQDVDKLVFPHVLQALERYAGPLEADGTPTWLDTHKNKSFADAIKDSTDADEDGSIRGKHSQNVHAHSPNFDTSTIAADTAISSRPEGWWSSDEIGNTTTESNTPATPVHLGVEDDRPASSGSATGSVKTSLIPKARGIALGKAGSVTGSVDGHSEAASRVVSGNESEGRKRRKRER